MQAGLKAVACRRRKKPTFEVVCVYLLSFFKIIENDKYKYIVYNYLFLNTGFIMFIDYKRDLSGYSNPSPIPANLKLKLTETKNGLLYTLNAVYEKDKCKNRFWLTYSYTGFYDHKRWLRINFREKWRRLVYNSDGKIRVIVYLQNLIQNLAQSEN